MIRVTEPAGRVGDPALAERLHELEDRGGIETVRLSRTDMSRRRQQVRSDRGTEIALMLDRDAALEGGEVLVLDAERAVVLVLEEPQWLVLRAPDAPRALELGYFAGNMHWKVRFSGEQLWVSLEGPRERYLERLQALLAAGVVVEPAAGPPVDARAPQGGHHGDGHSPARGNDGHAHGHGGRHGHGHGHEHEHEHGHEHGHSHAGGRNGCA